MIEYYAMIHCHFATQKVKQILSFLFTIFIAKKFFKIYQKLHYSHSDAYIFTLGQMSLDFKKKLM